MCGRFWCLLFTLWNSCRCLDGRKSSHWGLGRGVMEGWYRREWAEYPGWAGGGGYRQEGVKYERKQASSKLMLCIIKGQTRSICTGAERNAGRCEFKCSNFALKITLLPAISPSLISQRALHQGCPTPRLYAKKWPQGACLPIKGYGWGAITGRKGPIVYYSVAAYGILLRPL